MMNLFAPFATFLQDLFASGEQTDAQLIKSDNLFGRFLLTFTSEQSLVTEPPAKAGDVTCEVENEQKWPKKFHFALLQQPGQQHEIISGKTSQDGKDKSV